MQAVVGSSTGQVPCVKWTRGLGQMVFDGLGRAAVDGRHTSFMACGILLSGRIAASDNVLCAVRTTWCLVIWRDIVDTMATGAANLRSGGTNNYTNRGVTKCIGYYVASLTHTAVGTQY
jgi:hypothetical protein